MSRTECMIVDDVTRNSLVSQRGGNHNYYGGQGLGQLEADLRKSGDQAKKMYPEDTLYKANVASIHATDYKGTYKSEYTVEELLDLTLQLKALFARLKEKHCKKPGDRVTFNTGIFGGGAYRNSHVVMQVIQMLAAQSEEEKDGRGINLVFYGSETQYTNHDKNAHEEAKAFFNEMVNNNVSQYAILKALSAQGRQGEKSWLYQHGDRG